MPAVRARNLWQDDGRNVQKAGYEVHNVYMVKGFDAGLGYLVEWGDGVEDWHHRKDLIHGMGGMATGNLSDWLNMIDAFMNNHQDNLHDFMRGHVFGKTFAGADLDGLCGFRAVETALRWCGAPSLVTDGAIDAYCKQALKRTQGKINMKATGVTYEQLRGFIRGLPGQAGFVDIDVLNKNLYSGKPRGLEGVKAAVDEDGVYLVAGKTQFNVVGHLIAVLKQGSSLIAKDELGTSELHDQRWLHSLSYVRRFVWKAKQVH